MSTPSPTKTIGLLAYDDMQALDLAGPLDVFGGANSLAHGTPPYELCIIGLQARAVRAENRKRCQGQFGKRCQGQFMIATRSKCTSIGRRIRKFDSTPGPFQEKVSGTIFKGKNRVRFT
ncbi:hypothetical protein IMW82_04495 [Rhodanobacter sp. B2A1Ga4]|uniref:hypothetical protein n=1 Tax=Rhodanobacter sp. B2A1Ga4 TaxID=2778647 RepID=UPI001B382BB6|nr:hypothetical protein [Rhodanobacter sp. B2A1Ga4]MBQ4853926.1 hypothetical protein [Rhodanobacter sp. B2A1Ga4]